jgi:hypothetical protein
MNSYILSIRVFKVIMDLLDDQAIEEKMVMTATREVKEKKEM